MPCQAVQGCLPKAVIQALEAAILLLQVGSCKMIDACQICDIRVLTVDDGAQLLDYNAIEVSFLGTLDGRLGSNRPCMRDARTLITIYTVVKWLVCAALRCFVVSALKSRR